MTFTADQFTALPIDRLIGDPLDAACKAQANLANTTVDFITQVGMNKVGGKYETIQVDFTYKKANGTRESITVPLLAIVNVPNLSIQEVTIDFNMKVQTASVQKKDFNWDVSASGSVGGWGWKASMSASVGGSSSSTRSTDTSASYNIHVRASDPGYPEGLKKVMDILESVITEKTEEDARVTGFYKYTDTGTEYLHIFGTFEAVEHKLYTKDGSGNPDKIRNLESNSTTNEIIFVISSASYIDTDNIFFGTSTDESGLIADLGPYSGFEDKVTIS